MELSKKKSKITQEELLEGKQKKQKKQELQGSRWAALVLFLITILAGLVFYFQGMGGFKGVFSGAEDYFSDSVEGTTFVLE